MSVTLLKVGSVVSAKLKPYEKKKAEKQTAIEYILNHLSNQVNMRRNPGDRFLILKSGTGSGKSVTIPSYIHNHFKKSVIITQPRVLTAMLIPIKISKIESIGLKLGVDIGYKTKDYNKNASKVLFATIGVLAQQLLYWSDEDIIKSYDFIIIDECHDRSDSNIDLLFLLLKQFISRNYTDKNCPLCILMSATVDVKLFSDYFETNHVISVKGANYIIDRKYMIAKDGDLDRKERVEKYMIETVKKLHETDEEGDILIFVPSSKMSNDFAKSVKFPSLLIIELNSVEFNSSSAGYNSIFRKLDKKYKRRLIISTNIAETGVTIESLKYVIDSGLEIVHEYNPLTDANTLFTRFITKASAEQREGRVGRVSRGFAFPLYTDEEHKSFLDQPNPSIITQDMSSILLKLILSHRFPDRKDYSDIEKPRMGLKISFDMMGGVHSDMLKFCLQKLYLTRLIRVDKSFIIPTLLGAMCCELPLNIETSAMIMSGLTTGADLKHLATIASFLTHGTRTFVKGELIKYHKDDFINCLYIFEKFERACNVKSASVNYVRKWCDDNNLSFYGLRDISLTRWEIINKLETMFPSLKERKFISYQVNLLPYLKSIYIGFISHSITWNEKTLTYQHDLNQQLVSYDLKTTKSDKYNQKPMKAVYSTITVFNGVITAEMLCNLDDFPFIDSTLFIS